MTTSFMTSPSYLFTSESVTEGHPDKLCDQISDAVLDAILAEDPRGRVACETMASTGMVVITGEITTSAHVNYSDIAREAIRGIGYTRAEYGIDADHCSVLVAIKKQSPDIALGVDDALEHKAGRMSDAEVEAVGAGDQGMMIGFACRETDELMPLPIYLAHNLVRRLAYVRKNGTLTYLRPDGKSQVTVEYRYGRPVRVPTVLISTQHDPDVDQDRIHAGLVEHVIRPVIPADYFFNDIYAAKIDHDLELLSQLQGYGLRRLSSRAFDLSEESQNLLTSMAEKLRASEGLPEVPPDGTE